MFSSHVRRSFIRVLDSLSVSWCCLSLSLSQMDSTCLSVSQTVRLCITMVFVVLVFTTLSCRQAPRCLSTATWRPRVRHTQYTARYTYTKTRYVIYILQYSHIGAQRVYLCVWYICECVYWLYCICIHKVGSDYIKMQIHITWRFIYFYYYS